MRTPAILLIVLGVILGPAYSFYCEHLSGKSLYSFNLTERAERWTLADGTIQRFHGRLGYRPVEFLLEPQQNLVRLNLAFEFPPQASGTTVEYLATLVYMDYPFLEQPLRVNANDKAAAILRTFEVPGPGGYLFLLEELGVGNPAAVVALDVRGGIEQLFRPLMWFGYLLILTGIGVITYWAAVAARRVQR